MSDLAAANKRLIAADFYWDYERGFDIRNSRTVPVKSKMLDLQKREVLSLNGQYAIMEKNGGYITCSGVMVPSFVKTDAELQEYIEIIEKNYDKGVKFGISTVKSRFDKLFDNPS